MPGCVRAFLATASLLAAVFGVAIFYTLPTNILSSKDGGGPRAVFNEVLPQNWAFFTKDPQSDVILAYQVSDDGAGFTSKMITPQGLPSNAFGLSRTQRAQGPELANLQLGVPGSNWTACDGSALECLELYKDSPVTIVENTSPVPTVCGGVSLVIAKPVPWAFRDLVPYSMRTNHLVRIDAQC